MKRFESKSIKDGKKYGGSFEAIDEEDARQKLLAQGFDITSLREVKETTATEILPGIRFTRTVNRITIILNMIIVPLLVFVIAIPNLMRAAQKAGGTPNMAVAVFIGLVLTILLCVPAIILIFINKALLRLSNAARICQIIITCIFYLPAFPIGTILGFIILRFLLFDEEIKKAFKSQ